MLAVAWPPTRSARASFDLDNYQPPLVVAKVDRSKAGLLVVGASLSEQFVQLGTLQVTKANGRLESSYF